MADFISCDSGESAHVVAHAEAEFFSLSPMPAPIVSKTNSAGLTSLGTVAPWPSKYGRTCLTGPKLNFWSEKFEYHVKKSHDGLLDLVAVGRQRKQCIEHGKYGG